jgi:ArsR family transcriptional regulator, arsenate/arsenite/antimonite-responsive transcriptional repressor
MNSTTRPKLPVNDLAGIMKILSEPNRLRILCSMGLECVPVSAIIAKTSLSQTNVSFHLRSLREAGLVKAEKRGAFIYYCLYDTQILDILAQFANWHKNHAPHTKLAATVHG